MASPQHEPTMEEILASIRKIISEDSPAPQSDPPAFSSGGSHNESDVLDLTHEVHEDATPASSASFSTGHAQPASEQTIRSQEAKVSSPVQTPSQGREDIFSDKSRKALSDTVAELTPAARAASAEEVAPVSGLSLETVFQRAIRETFDPVLEKWLADNAATIIERMKPAIREWLDENFPAMLEDAVRSELARAVKARSRR